MLLNLDLKLLETYLNQNEDCSALSEREYIVDLYDRASPLTLDINLTKDGVEILAAARLIYDEEQDGWYMGDQVEDAEEIGAALKAAIGQND